MEQGELIECGGWSSEFSQSRFVILNLAEEIVALAQDLKQVIMARKEALRP